jgi:hypothetical protein
VILPVTALKKFEKISKVFARSEMDLQLGTLREKTGYLRSRIAKDPSRSQGQKSQEEMRSISD